MSGCVALRPHQREAVTAGVDALSGTRHAAATIIAACGTGKTLIGKRVAEHFAEHGPVLVLVPTLELLTQTAARWLADGGFDQLIGVCSLPGVHDRSLRGHLLLTSSPQVLARRVAEGGRIAVFATYASCPPSPKPTAANGCRPGPSLSLTKPTAPAVTGTNAGRSSMTTAPSRPRTAST